MPQISLVNKNTFLFVTILIISTLLISTYAIFAPEQTIPYNFNPFPQMTPSALPDPNKPTDSCWNTLTPCDSSGQCSACNITEYKCQTVDTDNSYSFNGINVPKGNWCIPNDQNVSNPPCNTYTGRWIWTFDDEYCAAVNGGSQCWKCECLYPSLFTGSENGCNTVLACQNDSSQTASGNTGQAANTLVSTSCVSNILPTGSVWNPTATEPSPDNALYNYTPYDVDPAGNPWFICDCPATDDGQYFARLPNDPHTCHLEPCYKYLGNREQGLQCESGSDCTLSCPKGCNCANTNFAKSPSGKFENTCVLITDSCGAAGYDPERGCLCGNGPLFERECKSDLTQVNANDQTLPDCTMPQNSLGSECYNPCEEMTCTNGSPCMSCGPLSGQLDTCVYDSIGRQWPNQNIIHATCDCANATTPATQGFGGWYGENCNFACFPADQLLSYYNFWYHFYPSGTSSCSACCSLNTHTSTEWYEASVFIYCDDGRPTIKYPPNPDCIPNLPMQPNILPSF